MASNNFDADIERALKGVDHEDRSRETQTKNNGNHEARI